MSEQKTTKCNCLLGGDHNREDHCDEDDCYGILSDKICSGCRKEYQKCYVCSNNGMCPGCTYKHYFCHICKRYDKHNDKNHCNECGKIFKHASSCSQYKK